MDIYNDFMTKDRLRELAEAHEIMAQMDENERVAMAKEEGLAEGEAKKAIEDIISFAKTGMSLTQVCQTLSVDENIKNQAIEKLNEMGIKYNK